MLKQEDITLEIDTNARYCRNITLLHYKSVIFAIAKDMKSNYHVSYIFTDMDLDIYKDSLKERIQKFPTASNYELEHLSYTLKEDKNYNTITNGEYTFHFKKAKELDCNVVKIINAEDIKKWHWYILPYQSKSV